MSGRMLRSRRAGLLAMVGLTTISLAWLWHRSTQDTVSVNARSGRNADEAQSAFRPLTI